MKLGLRLLLGFFLITGIAAFFVMRVFVQQVQPSVREVMEDMLVDTANILAELAQDDLAAMAPQTDLRESRFARRVLDYAARPADAQIWGLSKRTLDYRVYVTDAQGRVVFDTGLPDGGNAVGQDYSRWRDVSLTLSGQYGARAPPTAPRGGGGAGAHAMAAMRDRLDGHEHVEQLVRAMTHELKSPLAAIGGGAALLQDELPAGDRERFAR